MKDKIYKASSLDECLKKASTDCNLELSKLHYSILEEKKGFFKSQVVISVRLQNNVDKDIKVDDTKGMAKVDNNEIIVKNPSVAGNRGAIIIPTKSVKLFIDDIEVDCKSEVFEHNKIHYVLEESKAQRKLNIEVINDNMEVYADVSYIPEVVYGIKNCEFANELILEAFEVKKNYPPEYTADDIKKELKKNNITYGIIENNIEICIKNEGKEKILLAKGECPLNEEDDRIEMKISETDDDMNFVPDERGNIDFKSIGSIKSVHKGDTIAILYQGKPGQNGRDVYNNEVKFKSGKKINIKASEGCKVEDNKIISLEEGKPCIKGKTFYVYKVHKVEKDVDLKTGNIKFIGDVFISGNVTQAMKVEAGNSIQIQKDAENCTINAKGDISIAGNVILSKVTAGGQDVSNLKQIDNMKLLKNQLEEMMEAVVQIKKFNLLGNGVSDGEVIKVLIEKKFRLIPKICIDIINNSDEERGIEEKNLIELVKSKLLGFGPLSIRIYGEIDPIIDSINKNLQLLNESLAIPVNVKLSYCQDSTINSSGDIYITGRGEYVSSLTGSNGIYFEVPQSVARGGTLKANKEIRCKNVGSTGGVNTQLIVEKDGQIFADTVFQNTTFLIGSKRYNFEEAAKDVHAFLDEKGDIIVESLKL